VGWKDAPVVEASGGGWQSAPVVDAPPPPKEIPVTGTPPDVLGEARTPYALELGRTMAQNIGATVASGYAGLAGAVLPGPEGQGARWQQATQQALSHEPSKPTEAALKVVSLPGELYTKHVAKPIGEQGAKAGPLLGTLGETSAEAVPLLFGARAATQPKKPLTPEQQKVAAARDAGFVMTPEEMGAGVVPRTAASLSGEPRLARAFSKKNAALGTDKAKAELGIRPDAPLDLDTLALIRKQEGMKYDSLRNVGQVPMDAQYLADIDKLASKYKSAAKEFPGAEKMGQLQIQEINDAITMLRKEDPAVAAARAQGIKMPQGAAGPQVFDAAGAVDMIGALREGADGAFRGGKNSLGKVMRGGAEALEAQLERHLRASGNPGLLDAFQGARQRIAKTYAVERALVGEQVNPQALGRQVSQRKPLTGGLKETGEFARTFERSSQKPTHQGTGASFADVGLGLLNGIRTQGGSLVLDAATAGARPALRSVLLSRPAQWAMDPRTNLSGAGLQAMGASSALPPPQEETR
jgi:hypothetical protein